MDMHDGKNEHEAVSRLFDMAREGDTGNCEYSRLDAAVYDGLLRTYGDDASASTAPQAGSDG